MSQDDPTQAGDETTPAGDRRDPKYDNWPIEGTDAENVEYIGFVGGTGDTATPYLYQEPDDVVYEGTVDEENERIRVEANERRELESDETLADVVEEIGDALGWESLSEWANERLSDERADESDVETVTPQAEFHRRNVPESGDHQLAFFGSLTFEDAGRVHVLEREFDVFTDPDERTADGKPVAVVRTDHLVAEEPQEERRAGDAERVAETTDEVVVDVADAADEAAIEEWCREWHEAHLETGDRY